MKPVKRWFLSRLARDLAEDRRGNVSIIMGLCLIMLLGMGGLVIEYGNGLLSHIQNQRVADAGAYAGATVYNTTSSSAIANLAVTRLATLNGVGAGTIAPLLTTSPSGDGNQAYMVGVSTTDPLALSKMLAKSSNVTVYAPSYAEIGVAANGCIIALSSSETGVTLSGGTSISAPNCTVASNTSVTVPNGTSITTKYIDYNTTYSGATNTTSPSGGNSTFVKAATTDPITVSNSTSLGELRTAQARLATVAALTSPSGPTVTVSPTISAVSTPLTLTYYPTTTIVGNGSNGLPTGCQASYGSGWTVSCSGTNTTYAFNTITSGPALSFNPSGSSTNTYTFSGGLNLSSSGGGYTFGPGTYKIAGAMSLYNTTMAGGRFDVTGNVSLSGTTTFSGATTVNIGGTLSTAGTTTFSALTTLNVGGTFSPTGTTTLINSTGAGMTVNLAGGLINGGGATTTFGGGTYTLGALTTSCDSGLFSICNNGTKLLIGAPTTFVLSAGIDNGGGSTLCLGHVDASSSSGSCYTTATTSNTASFTTGAVATNSFNIGASSNGYSLYLDGGAYTVLGDATGSGDIFQLAGNYYGAGGGSTTILSKAAQHDINGWVSTHGGTTFGDGIYTISGYLSFGAGGGGGTTGGTNVTFVLGGATVDTSQQTPGTAFYVGSGYSGVNFVAPTTGATAGFAVIGPPASANYSGSPNSANSTAGAVLTAGASGTSVSGTFYFPTGPITLSGGASLGNGSGQCLELIGSHITLSGGTAAGTNCFDSGSSGTKTVKLIQ